MPIFPIRKPKPAPSGPSVEAVAAGLTALASDLLAGRKFALDSIGPLGELPIAPEDWAAYPTSPER
ncbi:hypothetical protein AB0C77_06705 [Streptomyces sp. NPDC048629]|uniref:hypothetical protein n=1 Tax=Streptomyces sp. NPDC048629 TaxID=3154824 RepID=UPI003428D483